MSETVKPHGRLSATDWLTNAVDAQPGMDIVWWDGGRVKRAEIEAVEWDDGQKFLKADTGWRYSAQDINGKPTMVVE
jgi:hypothetical protein